MENFNNKKLEILSSIGKLATAIDKEIDWYIASFIETDPVRKSLAKTIFAQKQIATRQLAKEEYERFR